MFGPTTFRQGDVLLIRVKELPKNCREVQESGDVILAHGEVTGHAHRIRMPLPLLNPITAQPEPEHRPVKVWDAGAERFIQVLEKTALTHEEHSPVKLDVGVYRVVRQREYDPQRARFVAD